MKLIQISKDNFDSEVRQSDRPVLLDFSAEWCGPCHMIAPTLHEIAAERPDIKVCKVDVDADPELAQEFQVNAIPTLFALKGGEKQGMAMGLQSKEELLALFED